MKEELKYIGNRIIEFRHELTLEIENYEQESYVSSINQSDLTREQIREWRSYFFQLLGESLFENYEEVKEKVTNWANEIGEKAVDKGIPLNETIATMGYYRTLIWKTFDKELQENQFAAITVLDVNKFINPLLDQVIFQFSQIYIRHNNEAYEKAQDKLTQLSVPVVPIADRVAVLPVIGELDPERAQLIMEKSLEKSSKYQLQYLLIDISGVPEIDATLAHFLFQVSHSLELVGVDTTLTGIRPEIARSVVERGVDFTQVKTRANLKQALNEIGISVEKA
ncbi:RsbT co-antagonist protein RsbRD [Halobacillus andaensis]|uniref:RsbT co-antagonist protein RsbRD n=1 Tax=Halobacillus andaensis TaxID=1176239 RepID=A0A917B425_HALAA|nr:STAS domain-containing protein [Halobacillus andaensis]MBP2004588.1 rsbT co-antagonist protein RsbR [Halobacillus andaensis]GGF20517.1 RsbT co-antagonist protein RsbRD [Halobacillus andaensis]